MILDKHVWRTADSLERLVWDGDPAAAILAYPKGTEIPDATARKLGLLDDDGPAEDSPVDLVAELEALRAENDALRAMLDEATAKVEAEGKAAAASANKARSKPADKAVG